MDNGIGGVIEHLGNDFAPCSRVAGSLDLDECRYRVLINQQMVDRPESRPSLMIGDSSLTLDQQPLARVARVDLCAREKLNVVCQKLLEISLQIVSGAASLGHEAVRTG